VNWWDSTITIEKYNIKMIEKYDIKIIIDGKCYMSKIVKWVTQIITRQKEKRRFHKYIETPLTILFVSL
jgi:hypothetical protein